MKEVIFNEKKYNVPESWNEVTLRMVINAAELEDILEDASIVAIISAYCDIPTNELKVSRASDVKEIMNILHFIYTPYESNPTNEFEYLGMRYLAEPDLTDQEFGDWVAIQTIIYNNRNNSVHGLAQMLAVYCKKDGEKLVDFDVEERSKLFMDIPFTTAKDVEGFFLSFQIGLQAVTQLSSTEKELESQVLQQFTELESIMNKRKMELGMFSPTRPVIGFYQIYLRSLKKQLVKYFSS